MAISLNRESLSSRWSDAGLILLLGFCAALPYLNTLGNSFVYDDHEQIVLNPYFRSFPHLGEIFTTTVWSFRGGVEGATNYYRPMMSFVYLVCFHLVGARPLFFHLLNVLMHAAVVLVLFKLTAGMFKDRVLAFVAAALFALHPVHSESVAWIGAITDLELTLFYLLAFWFYLRSAKPEDNASVPTQIAMGSAFVLALLSKEQALTLPLVATVHEHFYREDRGQTTRVQKFCRYGALWLLAGAYTVFRLHFLGAFAPIATRPYLIDYEAVCSALSLVGQYFGKLLWPVPLAAFYTFHETWNPLDRHVVIGCAALMLCVLLFVALWKTERLVSFSLVWLLATLVPVLNARWMPANVFAERYLYLPSVGFCWLFAWGCARLLALGARRQAWRRGLIALLSILGALCAIRIVIRNRDWRDDRTFFTRALAAAPGSFEIHNNLGLWYWNRDDLKGAEREWLEAERCAPAALVVLDNLGLLYTRLKRFDEAMQYLGRALQIAPNDTNAHLNLGMAYQGLGKQDLAEKQFRRAIELSPFNVIARIELGEICFDQGRLAEAADQFRRSLQTIPTLRAYFGLGLTHWRRGENGQAERAFQAAASLDPDSSRVHFMLALFYGSTGRVAEAMREYRAGFKIDPNNPEALATFQRLGSENPGAKNAQPLSIERAFSPRPDTGLGQKRTPSILKP